MVQVSLAQEAIVSHPIYDTRPKSLQSDTTKFDKKYVSKGKPADIRFYQAPTSIKFTGAYHFQKSDSLVIIVGEDTVYGKKKHQLTITDYQPPFRYNEILKEDLLNIVVGLWDSYEKECYADSMRESVDYSYKVRDKKTKEIFMFSASEPCNEADKKVWDILSEGTHYTYSHKQPTLEGFMNFLKSRGEK